MLLTDGYDEHSQAEFDATAAALRDAEVTLYVIGVGGIAGMSLKGENLLTELATTTGAAPGFPSIRSGSPSPTRRWRPTSSIATC